MTVRRGTVIHWAVEIPSGDGHRLVQYQTRERPARLAAQNGETQGFRLLRRQVWFGDDGAAQYGPWRDAALAGLIDTPSAEPPVPTSDEFYEEDEPVEKVAEAFEQGSKSLTDYNHDLRRDPAPRSNCPCSFCHYARTDLATERGHPLSDDEMRAAVRALREQVEAAREAKAAQSSEVKAEGRLYFVYRADSALPLLAAWRDELAALRHARDSGAQTVLGIDVTYRAEAPFTVDEEE